MIIPDRDSSLDPLRRLLIVPSRWLVVSVLALVLGACARNGTEMDPRPTFVAGEGVPYRVSIEGLPSGEGIPDVASILERALRLYLLSDRLPPSVARLRRRAESDVEVTVKVLRSLGFYSASVSVRLTPPSEILTDKQAGTDGPADDAGEPPIDSEAPDVGALPVTPAPPKTLVTLQVTPGPRFHMGKFQFDVSDLDPEVSLPSADELGVGSGATAVAAVIVSAEKRAVSELQNQGYAYASFVERDAVADPDANILDVTSRIVPGPRVRFGPLRIEGLETIKRSYLETYRKWTENDYYSASRLKAFRGAVLGTGLFDVVQMGPAPKNELLEQSPSSATAAQAPVDINLVEAKQRSVGLGSRFSTDEGPGATGYLEHRNLFGANETGRVSGLLALKKQQLSVGIRKPQFLRSGQSLFSGLSFTNETNDAFDERSIRWNVSIGRQVTKRLHLSAGQTIEVASIDDNTSVGTSVLLGLPLSARYDASDNLLDPTRGYRLLAALTPYVGTFEGSTLLFPVIDLGASAYWPMGRHVLAARTRFAAIAGEKRDDIPAPQRLYAGGAGSVRGYALRYIGPFDDDGDPIGGRSAVELGVELRLRITDSIGIVPFVEAGAVSKNSLPDFDEHVQYAAGLGLRYFTAIGPLRVDVGLPINPRSEDDSFQFYISIGQAF